MAKRKAKKVFSKYCKAILALISLVIIGLMFLPAVKGTNTDTTYTGFEVIFGKSLGNINLIIASGESKLVFSILGLLALALPLLSVILCSLLFGKSELSGLIMFVCFAGACVLFFILPSITNISISGSLLGGSSESVSTLSEAGFGLGIGAILAGSFAGVGALTSLMSVVLK